MYKNFQFLVSLLWLFAHIVATVPFLLFLPDNVLTNVICAVLNGTIAVLMNEWVTYLRKRGIGYDNKKI